MERDGAEDMESEGTKGWKATVHYLKNVLQKQNTSIVILYVARYSFKKKMGGGGEIFITRAYKAHYPAR